jgi:hypothetical protein
MKMECPRCRKTFSPHPRTLARLLASRTSVRKAAASRRNGARSHGRPPSPPAAG